MSSAGKEDSPAATVPIAAPVEEAAAPPTAQVYVQQPAPVQVVVGAQQVMPVVVQGQYLLNKGFPSGPLMCPCE